MPGEKVPITAPPSANLAAVREAPAADRSAETAEEVPPPPAVESPAAAEAASTPIEALPRPTMASVLPLPLRETAPAVPAPLPETTVTTPSTEIVAADVRFERIVENQGRPAGILAVEVEETLGHYAEWAGVRTQTIRHLNGLPFGRTLHLHQKVRIPLHRIGQSAFEEQRYEFHKRLQEDFFAVYRVSELETYRVRRGDSYWALCRDKFDIPLWLLKHYNSEADLADLRVRQKLIIPMIEETAAGDPATVAPDNPLEVPVDG